MTFKKLILILLTAVATTALQAQDCDTIVSFVNIYPGSDIYELEGHSILRIQTPEADVAISYGTFDFDRPNFVYRFVKGETDYWVTASPWEANREYYARQGRRIVSHRLNLDRDQTARLIELVVDNLQPANRTYRYNYVKDNCATRPLRIVELAADDSILLTPALAPLNGEESFRSVMRHFHRNYPWYQFGIDLALGSGIDYTVSEREKAFAPVVLDGQLPKATVGAKKLVSETTVINDVTPDASVLSPTPWYATPMTVGYALLLITIIITISDFLRHTVTSWFDTMLFGVYGLAGCLITFLVFVSVHEATSPNILLLWLNPFCFIPTIFLWIKRCKLIIFSYQIVNFVALLTLIVLWAAEMQALNYAFIPFILADMLRAVNYISLTFNKCR